MYNDTNLQDGYYNPELERAEKEIDKLRKTIDTLKAELAKVTREREAVDSWHKKAEAAKGESI